MRCGTRKGKAGCQLLGTPVDVWRPDLGSNPGPADLTLRNTKGQSRIVLRITGTRHAMEKNFKLNPV